MAGVPLMGDSVTCRVRPAPNLCSLAADAATDVTQVINPGVPLNVTTTSGFGIDTSINGGNALTLTGTGGLTFSDNFYSALTGAANGIYAIQLGTGALSVTSSGQVSGTSAQGIFAFNELTATSLDISADAVDGAANGIYALHLGSGALSVTVSGAVAGGTDFGIDTVTGVGTLSNVTLNSGADVSSTAGLALSNNAGDSATTVNNGASVSGQIRLGDGSDDLTFDGGDFSAVTIFDGGDDTSVADGFIDVLTFENVSGVLNGADVLNWENLIITGSSIISFGDNMLAVGDGSAGTGVEVTDGGMLGTNSPLFLTGNLSTSLGGALLTNIFSDTVFDIFDVMGDVDFGVGAELDFNLGSVTDYSSFDGLSLTFLMADSVLGFENLAFNFSDLNPLYSASVSLDGINNALSVDFALSGSAVPAPPALVLFGSGVLGLAGLRRVKRRG